MFPLDSYAVQVCGSIAIHEVSVYVYLDWETHGMGCTLYLTVYIVRPDHMSHQAWYTSNAHYVCSNQILVFWLANLCAEGMS